MAAEGSTGPRGPIVVGVDGSETSVAALRWAMAEAGPTGREVVAVTAWTH
ncbi:universal stress protein, partial [Amycolatopsis rhizosphaerae]